MEKKSLVIQDSLTANIKNHRAIFVFPTQICASMWAEKVLEFSGKTAIPKERFIAWDEFKSNSIRSQIQNKNAIPSAMRDIFAQFIVEQNSKSPFFKEIIPEKYVKTSTCFANWISSVLPSLYLWKTQNEKLTGIVDNEDKDLYELYSRYEKFLNDNNLFDPAWELPPFKDDGNTYFIFFPEILNDFMEYEKILQSASSVKIVSINELSKDVKAAKGYLYKNARIELKEVVHYLWQVHKEKKVPWNKIAISVPSLDTYGIYLEREMELYQIPYVTKNANPLTSCGAGSLFKQILDCYSENFSFESVKRILLNKELPWKDKNILDLLILFGQENNSICSFEYNDKKIDVWEESFKHPFKNGYEEILQPFYSSFKKIISKIVCAKDFESIRKWYFEFREKFFDFSIDNYPQINDKILSRCISELGALVDLEENFSNSEIFNFSSKYNYFCSYLDEKMYVPQNEKLGVNILPYKTASCAPYDVHIVVDSSQNSLSVVNKQMSFLREDKRNALNFSNELNVTEHYVSLYNSAAQIDCIFTCSEKTFDGYSFLNSYLKEVNCVNSNNFSFVKNDSYAEEKFKLLENEDSPFTDSIYLYQKKGFDSWQSYQNFEEKKNTEALELVNEYVQSKVTKDDSLLISISKLNSFYTCPRKFMLQYIMDVKSKDLAAELINPFTMGNINHGIVEKYFLKLKEKCIPIKYNNELEEIPSNYLEYLHEAIDDAINEYQLSFLTRELVKSTRKKLEKNIINSINSFSKIFNEYYVYKIEEWFKYVSPDNRYIINSQVDCILISPEEDAVLVDFKSGNLPSNVYYISEDDPYPNFQLPIYKFVIENCDEKIKEISTCMFFSLKDSSEKILYSTQDCFSNSNQSENNEKFNITKENCLKLVNDFCDYVYNNNFSPDIVGIDYDSCKSCELKSCCRKFFTVGRKND